MSTPTQADVDAGRAKGTGSLDWYLGKPTPDYSATFGGNATYGKNWRFNILFAVSYTHLTLPTNREV